MELVQNSKQMGTENRKEDSKEHLKIKDIVRTPNTVRLLEKRKVKFSCKVWWMLCLPKNFRPENEY